MDLDRISFCFQPDLDPDCPNVIKSGREKSWFGIIVV